MERFVYVIAFRIDRFLMVRHKDRKWEMPGGRLLPDESHEDAARREFIEETGHPLVEILGEIEIDKQGGKVFVGLAGDRINCELSDEIAEVRGFSELPDELSFPLVEYETMLKRARVIVESFKRENTIGGPLRH